MVQANLAELDYCSATWARERDLPRPARRAIRNAPDAATKLLRTAGRLGEMVPSSRLSSPHLAGAAPSDGRGSA
jgi:hypothetical protein